MTGDLVPLAQLGGMPAPAELRAALALAIQTGYAKAAAERGDIHTAEDTYAMQRRLGRISDQLGDYAAAFTAARKLVAQLQQEELVEAVGEQDDIPNGSVTVPDDEGDLRIGPDYANVHTIDHDQVVTVLVADVLTRPDGRDTADLVRALVEGDEGDPEDVERVLADLVLRAHAAAVELGSFTMQVSKVRAYAERLARRGLDSMSGVVVSAIRTHEEYKGVKTTRKVPR